MEIWKRIAAITMLLAPSLIRSLFVVSEQYSVEIAGHLQCLMRVSQAS